MGMGTESSRRQLMPEQMATLVGYRLRGIQGTFHYQLSD